MNCGLQSAPASISVLLLLLSATLFVLADGPVNATLEDAPMWFAMTEIPAQAYARAHAVWSQWLRHWHLTGDPRALRTTLVCQQIAEEKMAAWQAGRGRCHLRLTPTVAKSLSPTRTQPHGGALTAQHN